MLRSVLISVVVALVPVTTGCRMCAHPFDYCGPMCVGRCGGHCGAAPRAGSILSGPGPCCGVVPTSAVQTPTLPPESTPAVYTPTPAEPLGEVDASRNLTFDADFGVDPRMIISITDRKLEDLQEAAEERPEIAETRSEPSSGWKVVRPAASR